MMINVSFCAWLVILPVFLTAPPFHSKTHSAAVSQIPHLVLLSQCIYIERNEINSSVQDIH